MNWDQFKLWVMEIYLVLDPISVVTVHAVHAVSSRLLDSPLLQYPAIMDRSYILMVETTKKSMEKHMKAWNPVLL